MYGQLTLTDKHDVTLLRKVLNVYNIPLRRISTDLPLCSLMTDEIGQTIAGLVRHNISFTLEVK